MNVTNLIQKQNDMFPDSLFIFCFLHVPGWNYRSVQHSPSSFTARETSDSSIFTSMVELYMQQSEYKLDNRWYLFMLTMVVAVWKVISYWEVMNNHLWFYFPFP